MVGHHAAQLGDERLIDALRPFGECERHQICLGQIRQRGLDPQRANPRVDQRFQQTVGGQTVRPMQPRGRGLAADPQIAQRRPPLRIGLDPAHMVMRGRCHGNRLARGVNPCGTTRLGDSGELGNHLCAQRGTGIEHRAASGLMLGKNRAGDDIARRKLGVGMHFEHKPFAQRIDQRRAFAPQRLGGQRRGIAAHINRGRMELHEFRIGDLGPCPRRHADHLTANPWRVGRHREQAARAAPRQQNRRRTQQDPRRGPIRRLQPDADSGAVFHFDPRGQNALGNLHRCRLAHRANQRLHDLAACLIALHPHNAGF